MTPLFPGPARPKLCLGETHDEVNSVFSLSVLPVLPAGFSDCHPVKSLFERTGSSAADSGNQLQSLNH
jgi:hypothetical protein